AQIGKLRTQVKESRDLAGKGPVADGLLKLDEKAAALASGGGKGKGKMVAGGEASFPRVIGEMGALMAILQDADATPTAAVVTACGEARQTLTKLLARWGELQKEAKMLEEQLRKANP